jgi:hypothetical protein
MKISHVIPIIIVGIAGALLGCKTPCPASRRAPRTVSGFNETLTLVAKYRPAHLYIYADTASTNRHPDYVIFQGNEPLVIENTETNTIEVILSEKNFGGSLTTRYNSQGHVVRRIFADDNYGTGRPGYLYFDTNGDGLWDGFVIDTTNSIESYNRSNLCWVLRASGRK